MSHFLNGRIRGGPLIGTVWDVVWYGITEVGIARALDGHEMAWGLTSVASGGMDMVLQRMVAKQGSL